MTPVTAMRTEGWTCKPIGSKALPWAAATGILVSTVVFRGLMPGLVTVPHGIELPFARTLDQALRSLLPLEPMFRFAGGILQSPFTLLRQALNEIPAPILLTASAWAAYVTAGGSASATLALALTYCLVSGYWTQSLTTLALVLTAIPYAAVAGFLVGLIGARSNLLRRLIEPCLDLMQTIPTFAYLIPFLFLFGFGPIVGLLASVIFAAPPIIRNTILGLQKVPANVREAGAMAGCTRWQQFRLIDLPIATNQILVGLNQTTMAVFSMVIIAALIGGFNDVGWEVLSSIRQAKFGQSIMTGSLIVLLAIALDRVTMGMVLMRRRRSSQSVILMPASIGLLVLLFAVSAFTVLDHTLLGRVSRPDIDPSIFDRNLQAFTSQFGEQLAALKSGVLLYVLLPFKAGLENVVSEATWGFDLHPAVTGLLWVIGIGVAVAAACWSAAAGFFVLFAVVTLMIGVTGLPWPAVIAMLIASGLVAGGPSLGLKCSLLSAFVLVSGQWDTAAISVYLCGIAVVASVVLGFPIGVLAASSATVSRVVRAVCDTLQTIPQFVFLIPALMVFGLGDFPGLIAIISFTIVPIVRYTEEGLRQVPPTSIEAGEALGCTRFQMLTQVRLPQALPVLMLGINQAVLFSLGMLVISSLVGTEGLGQQIYVALSKNRPGEGLVAGLCMAAIGIMVDRIMKALAAKHQHEARIST